MSKPTGGRRPDYNLGALDKDTNERGTIGAAWRNPDGTINIRVNAFVELAGRRGLILTLFPVDYVPRTKRPPAPAAVADDPAPLDDLEVPPYDPPY